MAVSTLNSQLSTFSWDSTGCRTDCSWFGFMLRVKPGAPFTHSQLARDPAAFARKAPHLAARADLEFVQGDVRTFPFPAGLFPYVIHAATEASTKLNEKASHEMLDAIIGGTRRVLDYAAQAGAKQLLFTSSGAVYGPATPSRRLVGEDEPPSSLPLEPRWTYAEAKRAAEKPPAEPRGNTFHA